ncbi:Hypothetical predicted protein, partial [Marmota monax]
FRTPAIQRPWEENGARIRRKQAEGVPGPECSELHASPRGTEHLNGIGSQRIHQVAALLRSAGTEPAIRKSDHQRATWEDRLLQAASCLATVTQQAPVSTLLKAFQVISGKTEAVAQGVASGILELPLF